MLALSLLFSSVARSSGFSLRAAKSPEVLASALNAASEPGEMRDVFLFAGQSNCLGMGFQNELPAEYAEFPQNLKVWKADSWHSNTWNLTALPGQYGPEVRFAQELAAKVYSPAHESFGIVKVAKIMTSLYNDWAQDNLHELLGTEKLEELKRSTLRWEPGMENFEPWLFAHLVDSAQQALASEECAGQCRIKALLWVQGESDAMDTTYAAVYEKSLKKMVEMLRKELAQPDMKVVIAQVAPDLNPMTFPATDMMLEAEANYVEKEGAIAALVSAEGLEKMADHLHYNSAGQLDLGQRIAAAYLKM